MAQTGFTPIQLYSTSTAAAAPSAGNLTNSTLGSELAINITDGKLFYKDNANAVQVIGWKTVPTSAGGTGLTSYTAGDLIYYASGTTFTKLAIGAAGRFLSSTGSAPQWSAPAALTETDDTNVTLTLGGSPSTALLSAVSMTLGWTGTLAVSRGGTGTGTAFTAGSVVFAGASGTYSQDNSNLFWDDTNNRLGIATASPDSRLDVRGTARLGSNGTGGGVAANGLLLETVSDFTKIRWQFYGAAVNPWIGVNGASDSTKLLIGRDATTWANFSAAGDLSIGNGTGTAGEKLDVTGNVRASGIAQANAGVFYGGGKSVTCAVLNTWYNVSFYFGLYVFRDGSSGGTAACLFDGSGGAVFLSNNITGLAGQNSGGTLQIRVTSGAAPRVIYWACLSCVNG